MQITYQTVASYFSNEIFLKFTTSYYTVNVVLLINVTIAAAGRPLFCMLAEGVFVKLNEWMNA